MDCNTPGAPSQPDGQGCVFAIGSLAAALEKVPDHRRRRGVRFRLAAILGVMVLAKLAGEDQVTGIAEWPLTPGSATCERQIIWAWGWGRSTLTNWSLQA